MKLLNRKAIITGASQGFGLAVARAYVQEGASMVLCARSAEELAIARDEVASLAAGGAVVHAVQADISRPEEVTHVVDSAISNFGGIDILVANAGVYGPKGPIEEVDWDTWAQAITNNLTGTVFCCRVVVPHFKSQGGGKIIVVSGGGATK